MWKIHYESKNAHTQNFHATFSKAFSSTRGLWGNYWQLPQRVHSISSSAMDVDVENDDDDDDDGNDQPIAKGDGGT